MDKVGNNSLEWRNNKEWRQKVLNFIMHKNEYFTVARIQGRGERKVLEGASRKLCWSQIVKGFECQVL